MRYIETEPIIEFEYYNRTEMLKDLDVLEVKATFTTHQNWDMFATTVIATKDVVTAQGDTIPIMSTMAILGASRVLDATACIASYFMFPFLSRLANMPQSIDVYFPQVGEFLLHTRLMKGVLKQPDRDVWTYLPSSINLANPRIARDRANYLYSTDGYSTHRQTQLSKFHMGKDVKKFYNRQRALRKELTLWQR